MTLNNRKILWRAALRGGDDDLSRYLLDVIGGEPIGWISRLLMVIILALYVAAWRFYAQWLEAGHRFPEDPARWASFCRPVLRWGLLTGAALLLPMLAGGQFVSKRFWLAWMLPPRLESSVRPPDTLGAAGSGICYVGIVVAASIGGFLLACATLLIPYLLVDAGGCFGSLLALALVFGMFRLVVSLVELGVPASVSVILPASVALPASAGACTLLFAALQLRLGMNHAFPISMLTLLVVLPCALAAGANRAISRLQLESPPCAGSTLCFWIGAAPSLRELTPAMADAAVSAPGSMLSRWSQALTEEQACGARDPKTNVADLVSKDGQRRFIARVRLLDQGGNAIQALLVRATDQKNTGKPLRAQCRWLIDCIERETSEALGPKANQTLCSICRVHFWQHSFPPDGNSPPVATWYGCRRCGSSTTAIPRPARIPCRLEYPGTPRTWVDPAAGSVGIGTAVVPAPNKMPDADAVVIGGSVSDSALLNWLRQAAEFGEVEQAERLAHATFTIEGDAERFSDNALYWLRHSFRGMPLDSRGTEAARQNTHAIARRRRKPSGEGTEVVAAALFLTCLAALFIAVICVFGYFASSAYDWAAGETELRDVQLVAVHAGHQLEGYSTGDGPIIYERVDTWLFQVRFNQQNVPGEVDQSDQSDLPKRLNSTLKLKVFNSWLRHDEPNGIDWRASQQN